MAEPVRARRLTDHEGQQLQQIVRRGKHGSIRVRRAMIIMASSSGTPATAIARLVAADDDTVPDEILAHISPAHSENINFFGVITVDIEAELAKLNPAGWRPLRPATPDLSLLL
jgi:hypothetical protein